jgi:hypothetical protein
MVAVGKPMTVVIHGVSRGSPEETSTTLTVLLDGAHELISVPGWYVFAGRVEQRVVFCGTTNITVPANTLLWRVFDLVRATRYLSILT